MRKSVTTQSFVIQGSTIRSMYLESGGVDVRTLGPIQATKVSDVKFNQKSQLWEAIDRKSKKVVARHKSRKKCVQLEHQHYDLGISKGKYPWKRQAKNRRGSTK